MAPDLTSTLDRIASHIPCLERAAADETQPLEVRARVAAMVQLTRSAVITAHLKEADRGN